MKNTRNTLLLLGICGGLLFLAACASSNSPQAVSSDLTAPLWGLTSLNGQSLATGTAITAQFTSDYKISGSAGCNRYSGTYTASGSNLAISSNLATTKMACETDIMDQENTYLQALASVKTYEVAGGKLMLGDGSNKSLLVYAAQSQDLAGTSWQAVGYNNGKQAVVSVLNGTTLTLEFSTDGNVSGNSGCNTFSGPYKVTGDQIKLGPLAGTMMACSDPAGIMDQEAQYLAALGSASTYVVDGSTLELRTSDGALAADFTKK